MSWYYKPYVSVAQRRANGIKQLEKMKKAGRAIEPLGELSHRTKIATSFWGRAWCDHLEAFGDYENRLPRGRTYVRNGSVLHLSIEPGKIIALVQGSELYEQTILIERLAAAKWKRIKARCRGGIGSLIELLQGRVSDEIMTVVTDPYDGLFPKSKEIKLDCSCPDWASLCKHLAAILYGVGAKLDQEPELLFKLRGVDHRELIDEGAVTIAMEDTSRSTRRRTLDASSIGDVFGIELDAEPGVPQGTGNAVAQEKVTKNRKSEKRKEAGKKVAKSVFGRSPKKVSGETEEVPAKKRSQASSKVRFVATGDSVRQLREALKLTQADFAGWVGVSTQSVCNWEGQPGPLRLRAASLVNLETLQNALHRR